MNLVGKIFVFLIFVMSLFFMSAAVFVYQTKKQWRAEVLRTPQEAAEDPKVDRPGWRFHYQDLEAVLAEWKRDYGNLEDVAAADHAAKHLVLGTREAQIVRASTELTTSEQNRLALYEDLDKARTIINVVQSTVTRIGAELDFRRLANKVARQRGDQSFNIYVAAKDEASKFQRETDLLTFENKRIALQLGKARAVLAAQNLNEEMPLASFDPLQDGFVQSADNKKGLVEITVGSDDGLALGHRMILYRGSEFVAQVEIIRVTPDVSVGRIIPETQLRRALRGDRAETMSSLNVVLEERN